MGKRRKLIGFVLVLILGTIVWQVLRGPSEPGYKGKPLSYWLLGYYTPQNRPSNLADLKLPTQDQTREAVEHIGTNAVPLLLNWLRAKDSALKLKLVHLAQRQSFYPVHFIPAGYRILAAGNGFQYLALRPENKPTNAIPVLIQIYTESSSEESRAPCARAIGAFGPAGAEAIPTFVPLLTDPKWERRFDALMVLGDLRAPADLCVPAATKLLRDSNESVRIEAVFTLLQYAPDSKTAVPEILELHKRSFGTEREIIEKSLKAIDPDTAARVLTSNLNR